MKNINTLGNRGRHQLPTSDMRTRNTYSIQHKSSCLWKAGKTQEIREHSADGKYNVQNILLQCQTGTLSKLSKIGPSQFALLCFDHHVSDNQYQNRYSGLSSITAMTPFQSSQRVSDLRMADNQQPRERGWLVFKHHVLTHKIGETWLDHIYK